MKSADRESDPGRDAADLPLPCLPGTPPNDTRERISLVTEHLAQQLAVQAAEAPALPETAAVVLRAAADFIESAGLRSGVHVICGDGEVRISVWEPFGDIAARSAIVARLAVLIGGIVRQHDNPDSAISDLRADGTVGGLRVAVKTTLPVRRTRASTRESQPLAESPEGQVSAVPGKLPSGWRWVTALDAAARPVPRKPGRTRATTQASGEALQVAIRDRAQR